MQRQLQVVVALTALGAAACEPAVDDSVWRGTVEALPNGAVRVTNPSTGVWADKAGWHLSTPELEPALEPVLALVLGELDGTDATTFGSIAGLAVDENGRILVLDRHANELRVFDRDGRHVRSVGRSGGGPGEYVNANGLLRMSGDSIIVIDQQSNRYSILNSDGAYVRSVPRRAVGYGWAFSGGYHDGQIYEVWHLLRAPDEFVPALLRTRLNATSPLDTIMLPVHPSPIVPVFSHRTERGGMTISVPFTASTVYALAPDGTVWHGHGSDFRLVNTSMAGDTLREILLDAEPDPVTDEELAEWEAGASAADFRAAGGRIDISRIPRTRPMFDGIATDDVGNLWVSRPVAGYAVRFAVFDATGRYMGDFRASGMARNRWVAPVVRAGRVHIVGRDELDVSRVYVFRLSSRLGDP